MIGSLYRTAESAIRTEIAFHYAPDCPLLQAYLSMNNYNRITVGKHHLGDPGWSVWMMRAESSCGSYCTFTTRREAKAYAQKLSSHCGLSITRE